jgi:hypothetical protein
MLRADDDEDKLGKGKQREAHPEDASALAERPPRRGEDQGGQQHQAIVLVGDPELLPPLH